MARVICSIAVFLLAGGCERIHSPAGNPTVPAKTGTGLRPLGFDQRLLDILRCPENLTALHLATNRELDDLNERIRAGKLKTWDGKPVTEPVEALLIRADGKVGYRFQGRKPILILEEAIVLDESVGKPDPDKYRK